MKVNVQKYSFCQGSNDCNRLLGTDGLQFSPGVEKGDTLWMFRPELCRSIYVEYEVNITALITVFKSQNAKHFNLLLLLYIETFTFKSTAALSGMHASQNPPPKKRNYGYYSKNNIRNSKIHQCFCL